MEKKYNNGSRPLVVIAARISGGKQKEMSLEDQEDHAKQVAEEEFPGQDCEYRVFSLIIKGERIDRADLDEIRELLASGRVDLLLIENAGRLVRGTLTSDLFRLAVDHGTRGIAISNDIDTNDEFWESKLIKQCGEEVSYNESISSRVTFKCLNRYKKYGETPRRPIAGYIVPQGARYYKEWKRDDDATPVLRQATAIYRKTISWTAVSDFLNTVPYKGGIGFPVGECARKRDKWDGPYTACYFTNPLLHGHPARQRRKNKKVHKNGRRVPRKHDNPTYFNAPHLAHLTKEECDELQVIRKSRNSKFARKTVEGRDPLSEVSRGMSKFPGMHARCKYCGEVYLWGANGIVTNLMCRGSRLRICWNSRCIRGFLFRRAVADAIKDCLFSLRDFSAQYYVMVKSSVTQPSLNVQTQIAQLKSDYAEANRQLKNTTDAIAETGLDAQNRAKQQMLRMRLDSISRQLEELSIESTSPLQVPDTLPELEALFESSIERLMSNDRSAALELRFLIPSIEIELVAFADKPGHPLPRATLTFDLTAVVPHAKRIDGLPALLTHERVLDLFDTPQRVRIMAEAARIHATDPKLTHRQIADRILDGNKHPTTTAVGHALKLHKKMTELGLQSPLISLPGPEGLSRKYKRPLHKDYRQKKPDSEP